MKKQTVNGRASICEWSLKATFKTKEQAVKAIKELLEQDIHFPLSYEVDFVDSGHTHSIVIDDMPWAGNLKTVAKILQRVDYRMD